MTPSQGIEGSWGIEPAPVRLHVLSGLDTGFLWGNLGVSLLVIVAGAALVPVLSLPDALTAIVLRCVIGNLMLAVAGAIGTPSWWIDLVSNLNPPDGAIGATVPSFVVSFGLASVVAALALRSASGAAPA